MRSSWFWAAAFALSGAGPASATEWFVAIGGTGNGSAGSPFGTIQAGLAAAQAGDTVTVAAGTYAETLTSVRAGTAAAPITLRAAPGSAAAVVSRAANLLRFNHPYITVEGLVFDAQYAVADAVIIDTGADHFTLRRAEVRRATQDCIDIRSPANVLIEDSLVHHCLNAAGGRTDAHGIVASGVRDLTIRNTEIHTFSGDAFQVDPGRVAQRWDRVTIEGCRFWLAPLPAPENGFVAGTVTGENAVDTKILAGGTAGTITIRDTEAWGFGGGISNMAAFNLKEEIHATLDGVTVRDSEIAFRLRFPADVSIANAVVFGVTTAVRYEDNIVTPHLLNSTFGRNIGQAFQAASSGNTVIDARNLLVLGAVLPAQANGASNLAAAASAFVSSASDDYHLAAGSPAIDTGIAIAVVPTDRDGVTRPQGSAYDRGAYERCTAGCSVTDGGIDGGSDGGTDAGGDAGSDAGPGDAGAGDGGAGGDAGESPDGSTGVGPVASGCGCHAGADSGLIALLAIALAAWKRRGSAIR